VALAASWDEEAGVIEESSTGTQVRRAIAAEALRSCARALRHALSEPPRTDQETARLMGQAMTEAARHEAGPDGRCARCREPWPCRWADTGNGEES